MRPILTIFIPTFNRAEVLGRAIRSALAQRRYEPTIEILVLDDGSTDDSDSILRHYKDDILALKFPENRGVGWASQEALGKIETEYFLRLDSDDFLGEEFARVLAPIARLAEPKFDIVSCNYIQVDQREYRSEVIDLSSSSDLHNFGAGMLLRTETVNRAGGYNVDLRTREDLDLHLKLEKAQASRFHVPIPLYRRYIRDDNLSLKADHEEKKIRIIRDAQGI